MQNHEVAELISVIANSLRTDPSQFHVSVRMVGQQITSYGGTGLSVNVTGGGAGSRTIGNQVSMTGASMQIAQGQASEAVQQQISALCMKLDHIAAELRKPAPDQSVIRATYEALKSTWAPGVVIGVLGNLLSKGLGI